MILKHPWAQEKFHSSLHPLRCARTMLRSLPEPSEIPQLSFPDHWPSARLSPIYQAHHQRKPYRLFPRLNSFSFKLSDILAWAQVCVYCKILMIGEKRICGVRFPLFSHLAPQNRRQRSYDAASLSRRVARQLPQSCQRRTHQFHHLCLAHHGSILRSKTPQQ